MKRLVILIIVLVSIYGIYKILPYAVIKVAASYLNWEKPAKPYHIAGPVFYVGTEGLAAFLIRSDEGLILLNTCMPGSGPVIEASIRELGFKPEDIKIILTSHAHFDHAGGHAYIKKLSGAEVIIIDKEKDLLESGGETDFLFSDYPAFWFDGIGADKIIKEKDTVRLGDISMIALLTPGHTKGTTTWITNISENGKYYSVVFADGVNILPFYNLNEEPSYPGIKEDYIKTYNVLENLQPDIWFSYHNEFFDYEGKKRASEKEGINAWIDPEGYKNSITEARLEFEEKINTEE